LNSRGVALADLDAIYLHGLTEFGPKQADAYADLLAATMRLICDHPAITPRLPDRTDSLRRRSTGAHSIFFTAEADCIRIVRVLHQLMDPDRHLVEGGRQHSAA
jgi:toxin ParE1/3/4